MIENAFAQNLGGIIQRYIDWTTTDHEALRVGYSGTQLGHITRSSTSTERESIRLTITLVAIVCVVAAQRQLLTAALGKTNSSRRRDESKLFFSDYDCRKELMLRESESSLRERELLAGPATSLTQFPRTCRIPVDRSTRRGSLLLVWLSSNPSPVLIFLLIPPRKITKNKNSR